MTKQVVKTKRVCAKVKRRIRWDRVITCALTPVVAVCLAHGIWTSYTNGVTNAPGPSSFNEGKQYTCDNNGNLAIVTVTTTCTQTTEAQTTTTTYKNVVIDEKDAGFKLKIKTSAKDMGIEGIFFSKKLERIISVRDLQILMMLVLSEGAWEPYDTQVGIASTVLNRVLYNEKMFPNTIEKVVTQPAQFSPVIMRNPETSCSSGKNGFYNQGGKVEVIWEKYPVEVRDSVRQAVYDALDGADPTNCVGGAIYYCNMRELTYEELEYRSSIGQSITIGHTTFYREWG